MMAHTERFLSVFLLCIVLLALNQAKPNPDKGPKKGKGPRYPVPCQVYNGTDIISLDKCPRQTECAGDVTTMTYDGQEFNVTVCDMDSTEFDLATFLVKRACQLEDSEGVTFEVQTSCFGNDTCTGGPVSFTHDNSADMSASFCQEVNVDFDFLELLDLEGGFNNGGFGSDSSEESSGDETSGDNAEGGEN